MRLLLLCCRAVALPLACLVLVLLLLVPEAQSLLLCGDHGSAAGVKAGIQAALGIARGGTGTEERKAGACDDNNVKRTLDRFSLE